MVTPHQVGDQGKLHIDRVYAQGGHVVIQMLNYKSGEMEKRMLTPGEAAYRMQSIQSTTPKEYLPVGLAEAVIKACLAAKRQTLEGENEFYKLNQAGTVDEIRDELFAEIKAAREADPELDEEMKIVEAEAK